MNEKQLKKNELYSHEALFYFKVYLFQRTLTPL